MGYQHCKHCDEHFIESNGGTCDFCLRARIDEAKRSACEDVDDDRWGTLIDEIAPSTPIRIWLREDRKRGGWFARVNVGGWQRGDTSDAHRGSPTRAIAAALHAVMGGKAS